MTRTPDQTSQRNTLTNQPSLIQANTNHVSTSCLSKSFASGAQPTFKPVRRSGMKSDREESPSLLFAR